MYKCGALLCGGYYQTKEQLQSKQRCEYLLDPRHGHPSDPSHPCHPSRARSSKRLVIRLFHADPHSYLGRYIANVALASSSPDSLSRRKPTARECPACIHYFGSPDSIFTTSPSSKTVVMVRPKHEDLATITVQDNPSRLKTHSHQTYEGMETCEEVYEIPPHEHYYPTPYFPLQPTKA